MLSTTLKLASVLALSVPVFAAPEPNTVGFKFEKRRVERTDEAYRLARRATAGTVNGILANEQLLYFLNVSVGTPSQTFSLQLDTGSSDIWFPSSQSDICTYQSGSDNLCIYGQYDAAASSTFKNLTSYGDFDISYVDGTEIEGYYLSDVLKIGDTTVKNVTMAAALTAERPEGIMGIGFAADESSASPDPYSADDQVFTYPNIINQLKSQGFIDTLSYSLWLDDLQSSTGSILFGGVDSSKYSGDLISLPIQNDQYSGNLTSFTVAWTGLTVYDAESKQTVTANPSTPQPAILDSGTSLTYIPDDLATQLFNAFGVTTDPEYGEICSCNLAANNVTFSFQFGGSSGPTIKVPLTEMLVPLTTDTGKQIHFENGEPVCNFGIEAAGEDPILFGDTFLRSAYVVYDLENYQIGIAQTNFDSNTGANNVQAIGSSGIPGVKATAASVTVAQTFTDLATAEPTVIEISSTDDVLAGTGVISRSATLTLTKSGTATGSSGSRSGSGSGSGSGGSGSSSFAGNMGGSSRIYAVVVGVITTAFASGFAMLWL